MENIEELDEGFDEMTDELWAQIEAEDEKMMKEKIKTLTPTALISVWINEDGEMEEINLIEEFHGGDYGERLREGSDEYDTYFLKDAGIYSECTEKNALYHLYIHIDYYQSDYYEPEWDIELNILNTILVKRNYAEFIDSEDKYREDCRLRKIEYNEQQNFHEDDVNAIEVIIDENEDGWNWRNFKLNVTFNEVEGLIKHIATYDIKLAHRLLNKCSDLENILGELYNEDLIKVEEKRLKLKEYIKKTREFKYTTYGYRASVNSKGYYRKTVDISFEDINNLSDEDLLNKDPETLLFQLYYAKEIMNKLIDEVEEEV